MVTTLLFFQCTVPMCRSGKATPRRKFLGKLHHQKGFLGYRDRKKMTLTILTLSRRKEKWHEYEKREGGGRGRHSRADVAGMCASAASRPVGSRPVGSRTVGQRTGTVRSVIRGKGSSRTEFGQQPCVARGAAKPRKITSRRRTKKLRREKSMR